MKFKKVSTSFNKFRRSCSSSVSWKRKKKNSGYILLSTGLSSPRWKPPLQWRLQRLVGVQRRNKITSSGPNCWRKFMIETILGARSLKMLQSLAVQTILWPTKLKLILWPPGPTTSKRTRGVWNVYVTWRKESSRRGVGYSIYTSNSFSLTKPPWAGGSRNQLRFLISCASLK